MVSINSLGVLYFKQGRYSEAETFFMQALDIQQRQLGADHLEVATSLNNLALLYMAWGRYSKAETFCRGAFHILERRLGYDHPDMAACLNTLASIYYKQKRYGEAEPLFKGVLNIVERQLGTDHLHVAYSLNNLAELYTMQKRHGEAEPLFKRSLDIRERQLGDDHPDTANCLSNLALLYQEQKRHGEAEPLLKRSLDIRERQLGDDHPDTAISLNNLAVLYGEQKRYGRAETLFKRALAIRERILTPDHPYVGESFRSLAELYKRQKRYGEAKTLLQRFLDIQERQLGADHLEVANCLTSLSLVRILQSLQNTFEKSDMKAESPFKLRERVSHGIDSEAEILLRRALNIVESQLGSDHIDVANCLNNLAALYWVQDRYSEAEPFYQRALNIWEHQLEAHDSEVLNCLHHLSQIYTLQERYSEAESIVRRALDIVKRQLGADHLDVTDYLNRLAELLRMQGLYSEAEPFHQRSLNLRELKLGADHLDVADSLNNLALVYSAQGRYGEAEPLYKRCLEISEHQLGGNDHRVAFTLNNLALVYRAQGRYSEAEPLYKRSLDIRESQLGTDHPHMIVCLYNLAGLQVATCRAKQGLQQMVQANKIGRKVLGQIFSASTDRQRLEYLALKESQWMMLISLANQNWQETPEAVPIAFQEVIYRKALGADAGIVRQTILLSKQYRHLAPQMEQLQQLDSQICALTYKIPTPAELPAYRIQLHELQQQWENLDRQLCRQIPEMNLQKQLEAADISAIAKALPQNSILVEFVCFKDFNFNAILANGDSQWLPERYVAFVMSANKPEQVYLVDLGEAASLDQLIGQSVQAFCQFPDVVRDPFLDFDTVVETDVRYLPQVQALYRRLIAPLEPYLKGHQQIFLAPDGELSRLPFHTLPTQTGHYLMECYDLRYLSTGRDLLRFQAPKSLVQPTQPLVIADPDYNLSLDESQPLPSSASVAPASITSGTNRNFDSIPQDVYADLRNGNGFTFESLPGSRIEGERVSAQLAVPVYLGAKGLKSLVSQCCSPIILHMATHGYFLRNYSSFPSLNQMVMRIDSGIKGDLGVVVERYEQVMMKAVEVLPSMEVAAMHNPSARSGLAFAGANTTLRGGILPPEAEDGLLTTQAAAGLNLVATQLVVASACQTALGDVMVGEGVLGLRRAFVLAGAQTLIVSLWTVNDVSTAILMERFYINLIEKTMGRADALKEAQYYVRDLTIWNMRGSWLTDKTIEKIRQSSEATGNYLKNLKQRKNSDRPFEHPQYWGAFICQGNPDPLPEEAIVFLKEHKDSIKRV